MQKLFMRYGGIEKMANKVMSGPLNSHRILNEHQIKVVFLYLGTGAPSPPPVVCLTWFNVACPLHSIDNHFDTIPEGPSIWACFWACFLRFKDENVFWEDENEVKR